MKEKIDKLLLTKEEIKGKDDKWQRELDVLLIALSVHANLIEKHIELIREHLTK